MTEVKARRQQAIVELIRTAKLTSQEDLAARLEARGFSATQATVSRDLEQLGAVKVRKGNRQVYALPNELAMTDRPAMSLATILRNWVRSVDQAGNLLVIKTPPGTAHVLGVALDQAGLEAVMGTICGDDTTFVACRSPAQAKALAIELQKQSAGEAR